MKKNQDFFERLTIAGTRFTGSTSAFIVASLSIIIWGVSGPIFNFSDSWQLIMNTATSIITFIMVFIIQRSQNKDAQAIHIKLDELLSSMKQANNKIVDIENLSEKELKKLARHYRAIRNKTNPNSYKNRLHKTKLSS